MAQRKSETPARILLSSQQDGAKAGIDIRSTPKLRDQHVKSFIRKLIDKELRATLQGQHFRSMADLEFILKRHDETWHEETDASPSQVRDFRADNQHMRRHRPKRYGKAFVVTHSEDESEDGDYEMDSSSEGEETPTKSDLSVPKANQSESFAKQKDACNSELRQEMPQEVFRIMDNSGWKPPNGSEFRPRSPSPWFGNFSQSKHCDNCGEGSYTTDSSWMDIECERCHQLGNSSQMCRIRLCNLCGRYHDGKCDDPKILRLLKTLVQQGQLDLKEHFSTSELNQFLDGDAGFGGEAVKPVNPLDGDPERVGLKDISQLCVLVYVGPELRSRDQDNHQYMSVIENDADLRPEMLILENQEWDSRPEFQLNPGERYGWWANHDSDKCQKEVMVHGAVNNCRTNVLFNSGATMRMLSLDHARRLKLNLIHGKPLRVTGLGGIPTIITARTEVKITLGPRVVYVIELWVANIGEGVNVLLGMDFMHAAGFRLCIREGFVKLPDEETLLSAGAVPVRKTHGLDLPIYSRETLIFDPEITVLSEFTMGQPSKRSGMGRARRPMGDPAYLRWQAMASCSESG